MNNSLARSRYRAHRKSARKRGVEFLLTFDEWLNIWTSSGHFNERGKGGNKYCMARFGDLGPYAVGNVRIITNGENNLEAAALRSPEAKKKIGDALRGRKNSAEVIARKRAAQKVFHANNPGIRAGIKSSMYGRTHSAETKAQISAAKTGRVHHDAEARVKIGIATKEALSKPEVRAKLRAAGLGRRHSAETIAKMRAAKRGKIVSAETKARMSAAQRLRAAPSAETRAKIAAANTGRMHSTEAKAKMVAAVKARCRTVNGQFVQGNSCHV